MGLIELIVTIAVVGLLAWAITTIVPMREEFKRAITIVALVGVIFYLLSSLGLWPHALRIR